MFTSKTLCGSLVSLALAVSGAPSARAEVPAAAASESVRSPEADAVEARAKLARELGEIWRTASEAGDIDLCPGVLRSPAQVVEHLEGRAAWIARAVADPQESFAVWKAAQRIRFGIEMVRGQPRCQSSDKPGNEQRMIISPAVDERLTHTVSALIELLEPVRAIPPYEHRPFPAGRASADFVLAGLIDAFEARVRASELRGEGQQERPPEPLRRLVYVAALTTFDLDRLGPLRELLAALESDTSLQYEKRELLLLQTRMAIALVQYESAMSLC
jgi:hypothetical protein